MGDLQDARVLIDVGAPSSAVMYSACLRSGRAAGLDDPKGGGAKSAGQLPNHVNALEAL